VPAPRPTTSGVRATRPAPIPSVLLAILAFLVAACGTSATPRPTTPPDATGSLVPSVTATPASSDAASPSPAFPITLTGDDGETITLASEPDQVVSLTPAETEILFAIGAGDKVVGKVEDIANFPPEASAVPVVGTFSGVDVEKIVSLGSDLVIAGGNGGTPQDAIDKLRDLKIPVLVVYAPDVEGALGDISLTGQAVGESDAAAALVATMQDGFDQVAAATAGVPKPKVFYETGDQPSIYGIADDSVYAQMIGLAGGTAVTTGSATNWEMSIEKLVSADPDLIILGDSAYGVTAAAVAKRPGWAGITAVKSGAIHGIDDIVVTRPGPRLVDGLLLLVGVIHPELGLGGPVASPSAAPSGG
jgi:iron complex transport system substrate-binding protein